MKEKKKHFYKKTCNRSTVLCLGVRCLPFAICCSVEYTNLTYYTYTPLISLALIKTPKSNWTMKRIRKEKREPTKTTIKPKTKGNYVYGGKEWNIKVYFCFFFVFFFLFSFLFFDEVSLLCICVCECDCEYSSMSDDIKFNIKYDKLNGGDKKAMRLTISIICVSLRWTFFSAKTWSKNCKRNVSKKEKNTRNMQRNK